MAQAQAALGGGQSVAAVRRPTLLECLRRGRASWSVAALYLLLLPIVLGILPKPEATAEFLLQRDLATVEICTMPSASKLPGQPIQHQPDCILCSTACPFAGPVAATSPAEAAADPFFLKFALAAPPKDFAPPALRLFTSEIQPRGPPTRT